MLRKYFLARLFVPLIKGSVSPQFKAVFGKFDRCGPYKNSEKKNIFWLKFVPLIKGSVSIFAKKIIFFQNYLFNSSKEVADLTKYKWKFCTILNCAKKIFFG